MPTALDVARQFLGRNESRDNAVLRQFFRENTGSDLDPATTAWCARFMRATLARGGYDIQGATDMARSFLNVGQPVDTPQVGDIVVLSRGGPNSQYGHVGVFAGYDAAGNVRVVGGNTGNSVAEGSYAPSRVLGFRRPQQGSGGAVIASSIAGTTGAGAPPAMAGSPLPGVLPASSPGSARPAPVDHPILNLIRSRRQARGLATPLLDRILGLTGDAPNARPVQTQALGPSAGAYGAGGPPVGSFARPQLPQPQERTAGLQTRPLPVGAGWIGAPGPTGELQSAQAPSPGQLGSNPQPPGFNLPPLPPKPDGMPDLTARRDAANQRGMDPITPRPVQTQQVRQFANGIPYQSRWSERPQPGGFGLPPIPSPLGQSPGGPDPSWMLALGTSPQFPLRPTGTFPSPPSPFARPLSQVPVPFGIPYGLNL